MQVIGRLHQLVPDGAPWHDERHRPEQTTPLRLVQQHAASFIAQTEASTGADPINGFKRIDAMRMFNDDPDTDAVIMIGEIGGPDEADAARWCEANMKKPNVGFIAGALHRPARKAHGPCRCADQRRR